MRTSRKKLSRLDEEDYHYSSFARKHHRNHCPFCTEWEACTVHTLTEELTRRKPRYKQKKRYSSVGIASVLSVHLSTVRIIGTTVRFAYFHVMLMKSGQETG